MNYLASLRMASTVLLSSGNVVSMFATISSTRVLSYPIPTREDMRIVSLLFWTFSFVVVFFFEKSIDHLRSTIIFWAVFLPIPGTLERILSSSSCIACMRACSPSPRRARAVFPPTPLTLLRSRKSRLSSWELNPNNTSLISVLWWCIQREIFLFSGISPSTDGDTSISNPSPVPWTRTVRLIVSMARMSPCIYQNICFVL